MGVQRDKGAEGQGEKRALFFGRVTPDEAVAQAQVMVVVNGRWFIHAPEPYRCNGSGELPVVSCPVVDCSGIPDDLFAQMARVIGDCVDVVHGVINRSGLLTGLEALGAKVQRDKGAEGEEYRYEHEAVLVTREIDAGWVGEKKVVSMEVMA